MRQAQLRLVYSLLKPAVRAAARFNVPIRTLAELMRLAYFEELSHDEGLSMSAIAGRFGQSTRNMFSLARKLKSGFFAAETEVGLVRDVEAHVGAATPTDAEVRAHHAGWDAADVDAAIRALLAEGRVERQPDGRLATARRYVVLRSDEFHHRIDSLNHLLAGVYRAVLHRLVLDDRETAMTKTISFSALPEQLKAFLANLEGTLRRELAALDESATFAGKADQRYTLVLALGAVAETPHEGGKS